MISRRHFLYLGAAALALPARRLRAQGHAMSTQTPSPALTPFVDPLPIPPVLTPRIVGKNDAYTLTMQFGLAKCHRDLRPTPILGFNGLFPGPTIVARRNRGVLVRQINNLPPHTSHGMTHLPAIHLHGAHVAPEHDGHPGDMIPTGGFRDYVYPNRQRGAALWYHDHTHGATGLRVNQGLAGLYLVRDSAVEAPLRLPAGALEIPLIIQDRAFTAAGHLQYMLDAATLESGFHGDCLCVNGKVQPYCQVGTRRHRLRILNGSNARIYRLALSNGDPLIVIGTDGGLLQRPRAVTSIEIGPAERLDVLVDFSAQPVGAQIVLQNLLGTGPTAEIMRFDVTKKVRETAIVPSTLALWEELPEAAAVTTRDFTLNRTTIAGALTWTINGQAYDPAQPPLARPIRGSIERWRFVNPNNHPHPMHLHLVQFQVVALDDEPVEAADYGWKDTFVIPANSTATLLAKFSEYTGRYVFHCHNLEHEDFAMMGEFEVVAPPL